MEDSRSSASPNEADPNLVYIENTTSDLYLEDAAAVDQYDLSFDHLRASALPVAPTQSNFWRRSKRISVPGEKNWWELVERSYG